MYHLADPDCAAWRKVSDPEYALTGRALPAFDLVCYDPIFPSEDRNSRPGHGSRCTIELDTAVCDRGYLIAYDYCNRYEPEMEAGRSHHRETTHTLSRWHHNTSPRSRDCPNGNKSARVTSLFLFIPGDVLTEQLG